MADTSRPQVRSWPCKGGHYAHFRKPGGGWQFVRIKGSVHARVFPTSEEAKDAARELVFDFLCPPIVAARLEAVPVERTADEEAADRMFAKMQADAQESGQRRAVENARLRSETFTIRKAGKKPVVVETKRRRA